MEELTKICPVDEALRDYQPEVKALVLPLLNNHAGCDGQARMDSRRMCDGGENISASFH